MCGEDHAGGADAALRSTVFQEALLDGMEFVAVGGGEAFDGGDLARLRAWRMGTRQELTSSPFMRTEQEPHSPSPQPSLAPVRWRSSRRTSSRRFMGGASTVVCRR